MQTVLVCTGDIQLFLFLRHILASEGFDATLCSDVEEMSAQASQRDVATMVLDWQPQAAGFLDPFRRALPGVPLILFARNAEAGADGLTASDLLLTRPFDPAALTGFLSRLRQRNRSDLVECNRTLRWEDLRMDVAGMKVQRAGQTVPLTALQFRLLRCLLERPTGVCDREALVARCWPAGAEVEPRTVDIHIGHIRRKLLRFGPDLIRTVRGAGYALDSPCTPETGWC
ncbi:MAG: response regulator transcription factor [Pseudomonadota bacterium]|nr:response regulator transcription factor [Pseudomonadota bacterium]